MRRLQMIKRSAYIRLVLNIDCNWTPARKQGNNQIPKYDASSGTSTVNSEAQRLGPEFASALLDQIRLYVSYCTVRTSRKLSPIGHEQIFREMRYSLKSRTALSRSLYERSSSVRFLPPSQKRRVQISSIPSNSADSLSSENPSSSVVSPGPVGRSPKWELCAHHVSRCNF